MTVDSLKNEINDFCFVVIAYNQEEYVIEHLESIKYLIIKYSKNLKIQLVFSDDSSTDNTVSWTRKWLKNNKDLFSQFEIVEHERNVGTIRNIIDGISKVNARSYKLLSCDDLYHWNNIFEVQDNKKLILSPMICFFEDGDIYKEINPSYKRFLISQRKGKLKHSIREMLRYNNCIEAPGAFVPLEIWHDDDFKSYLKQFIYIEDIPEWHYIFNNIYEQVSVEVVTKPYVLYRRNVGISTKIKKKNNPIDDEYKQIRKIIKSNQELFPKYFNLYGYIHYFGERFYGLIFDTNREFDNVRDDWNREIIMASRHLERIKKLAIESRKSIFMNESGKENKNASD